MNFVDNRTKIRKLASKVNTKIMADDYFRNTPENRGNVNSGTSVTREFEDTQPLSPEELQSRRVATLSQETRRLFSWLGLLTGLSVLSLGLLAGFAFYLKRENDQLQKQLSALNTYKAEIDRVSKVESRVNAMESQVVGLTQAMTLLNQQVPKGLPNQIKAIQTDISALKAQTQKNAQNAVSPLEVQQSIQRALIEQSRPVSPSLPPSRQPLR